MRAFLECGLCVCLLSCRAPPGPPRGTSDASAPERPSLVDRLPDANDRAVLYRPGTVLLVGEVHGTEEVPDLFGALVADAVASGVPVVVGVEMKRDEQPSLDAFMRDAAASVPAGDHWRSASPDGRSSRAVLRVLSRARDLARSTGRVRLVAIGALEGAKRDAAMAGTVAREAKTHPDSVVLVLAGSLHTRLRRGARFDDYDDPEYEPMGYLLTARGLNVMGIRVGYERGAFWGCLPGRATCGPFDTDGYPLPNAEAARLHALREMDPEGNTYGFAVGVLHASPPALPREGP